VAIAQYATHATVAGLDTSARPLTASGRHSQNLRYTAIIIGVVAARYAMMIVAHFWSLAVDRGGLAPNPSGIDDGDYYWGLAQLLADGWDTDAANIFPVVLGTLMRVTGIREILFYKHINFLIGLGVIAAAVSLYRACVPAARRRSEMFLVLLLGLYPSALVFEHISLYRDGWIFLLHMVALLLCMRTPWRRPLLAIPGALGLIGVLSILTSFRWYVPVAGAIGAIMWTLWRRMLRLKFRYPTAIVATGFLLTLALVVPLVYSGAFGLFDSELLLRALDYRSGETTGAGSSLGISFRNVNSVTVVPLFVYSFASNIWGPLPWQISSTNTFAGFVIESSVMVVLTVFLYRWRSRITIPVAFIAFQAAAWFATIGFFNDNLGTALRLRVLGWHLGVLLFAVLRDSRVASVAPKGARDEVSRDESTPAKFNNPGE